MMAYHYQHSMAVAYAEGVDVNNPLIGWDNLVTTSNVASTTANSDYPISNVANSGTHNVWKGTSTVANEFVTVTSGGSDAIDFVGVARHNFGSAGIVVTVQGDLGSGYVDLVSFSPANDKPIVARFVKENYTAIRLKLEPGSEVPTLAVLYVGELLTLPRRIYVGHTPFPFGRKTRKAIGQSESGNFLGSLVTGRSLSTNFTIDNILPDWYRDYMDPFIEAASDGTPFFFAWRPGKYPDEVAYAWLPGDAVPSNSKANGMMSIALDMNGIV